MATQRHANGSHKQLHQMQPAARLFLANTIEKNSVDTRARICCHAVNALAWGVACSTVCMCGVCAVVNGSCTTARRTRGPVGSRCVALSWSRCFLLSRRGWWWLSSVCLCSNQLRNTRSRSHDEQSQKEFHTLCHTTAPFSLCTVAAAYRTGPPHYGRESE